jgi:hypothetical protein
MVQEGSIIFSFFNVFHETTGDLNFVTRVFCIIFVHGTQQPPGLFSFFTMMI